MEQVSKNFNFKLWRYAGQPGELIPLLQAAQDHYGYIPERAIEQIAQATEIRASRIYGVITFYNQFRLQPMGKYELRICMGTACHVAKSKTLLDILEDELGIHDGETDEHGLFTINSVACIGCCSLAPVMVVNDEIHGSLDTRKVRRIIKRIKREEKQQAAREKASVK